MERRGGLKDEIRLASQTKTVQFHMGKHRGQRVVRSFAFRRRVAFCWTFCLLLRTKCLRCCKRQQAHKERQDTIADSSQPYWTIRHWCLRPLFLILGYIALVKQMMTTLAGP